VHSSEIKENSVLTHPSLASTEYVFETKEFWEEVADELKELKLILSQYVECKNERSTLSKAAQRCD
jgi:hypothetical protein